MAESRAKRMQLVLTLAERQEQKIGEQLAQIKSQLAAESEHLRQLDDYAAQYLHSYTSRKTGVRAQELITYSSFIQRLGDARSEQQQRIERVKMQLERLLQSWRIAHQKSDSIRNLIERLTQDENLRVDKRLQKEIDELVSQAYCRRQGN